MKWLSMMLLLGLSIPTSAQELISTKLKDTIKKGYGEIDLFRASVQKRNPTAADLEAFRQNNAGALVFAVDVNEAANGTEKADSQGVALASARLQFTIDGVVHEFGSFSTPYETMLAPEGSTDRTRHYTLIGRTGSSTITSSTKSDIYNSSFDAFLTMPVDIDISQATEARLIVQLQQTNGELGDPEAFYDFTGGYEDVALITAVDATALSNAARGVDQAPLVIAQSQITNAVDTWLYYPSSTSYYIVAYEDKYPQKGDYDFNDLVVGYRVGYGMSSDKITSVVVTGYMIARGSDYTHDWYLRIPFPDGTSGNGQLNLFKPGSTEQVSDYPKALEQTGDFNVLVYPYTKSLMFDSGYSFANTLDEQTLIQGHKFSVSMNLDNQIAIGDLAPPPYDPYLYIHANGYEVHLPNNKTQLSFATNASDDIQSFSDEAGYPFALIVPEDWHPPLEYMDLGEAYGNFLDYVSSSGSQESTWYMAPENTKIKSIGKTHWKW